MQFVTNGPDIPDALLQAHEEGRVVFFCGAGISYPAGLPSFSGLVKDLYSRLSPTPNEIQEAAIKAGQFDIAIGLLEDGILGGREVVRREIANILTPRISTPKATATHDALLTLGKNRNSQTKLITTNFDQLFEQVIAAKSLRIEHFKAPLLPVPKRQWDGLVYLHGLITTSPTPSELDRLVVSSGDFGLAYLTERWAARFASELFRNYSVCFVGYSINDPVLRYMMDALAADRLRGETVPEMFAFGSFSKSKEEERSNEWRAKKVTPILYREHNRHSYLHKTLQAWAKTYQEGALGKEQIVVTHALTQPSASTQQDNFVGRMLWALSDKSGLPAKRFANFNPAPSLDWLLEAFSDDRFQHADLPRFGVPTCDEIDSKLRFSLIRRPAPYLLAPRMSLVSNGATVSQLDNVMRQLGHWLVRHLNDQKLVIWIAQQGGQLHDQWRWLIEHELDRFARLEREGKTSELEEIRRNAPNAIPEPFMRTLWRLLLCGRVQSSRHAPNLYHWKSRLKRDGLTATLRLELRDLLAPKIALKKAFHWREGIDSSDQPTSIEKQVSWELVLTTDHVNSALRDRANEELTLALPSLLDDFQQLLRYALDLLHELGEADDRNDLSHWALPSISPHWQNRGFRDWATLIELLRDAWLAVLRIDAVRATRIAQAWFEIPYPTFKRLAFFAASHDGCIAPEQWVDWMLADDSWWLWSTNTSREVFRILVLQGGYLAGSTQERLEAAILVGPPREMYRNDLEPERWKDLVDHSVWLHLAKLDASGLGMGSTAKARLVELTSAYPQWRLASNERDEFSHWMSGTGDPDYEENRDVDIAPRKRRELVQWLIRPQPERRPYYEDSWREACKMHPLNCLFALADLAEQGNWLARRWSDALYSWANTKQILRMWRYSAPLLQKLPDTIIQEITDAVTWWIETVSKSVEQHEDILFDLCRRILALPLNASTGMTSNGEPIDEPVSEAC